MQYYTVVAESYESALNKARELYGNDIRINSRRDYYTRGGLFTRREPRCEIVCYLAEGTGKKKKVTDEKDMTEFEKEARTPNPSSLSRSERLDTEIYREKEMSDAEKEARRLLEANHITEPLFSKLLENLPEDKDPRIVLPDRIISLSGVDYTRQVHPKRFVVFIGPTGSGKTTTLAKTAYLYAKSGKRVAVISLDTYRVGAYEQIKAFGDALSIPVAMAGAEDELVSAYESFSWKDVIFIDTMGLSPKDQELNLRLRALLGVLDKDRTDFILTVSASMKEEDAMEQFTSYSEFGISSLAVTKLDETDTIGNVLSFSYKTSTPIMLFTDGQKVPDDIKKASSALILEYLKGFGLDMKGYRSQVSDIS